MAEKPETRIMRNQVVIMQTLWDLLSIEQTGALSRLEHHIKVTEECIVRTSGEYPHAETVSKRKGD